MVLDQNNLIYFERTLTNLKEQNLLRQLKTFDNLSTCSIIDNKYNVLNFSSNDYLGLSVNKIIKNNIKKIASNYISQCSSRLISGHTSIIQNFENILAQHRKTDSALIFPTGYMANLGVLGCIADKDTIIFSDELNHASIIDGCKLSGGKTIIFPHNNFQILEKLVKTNPSGRKIIITEGLFSMNGDFAKLKEISQISEQENCILVVDDAHGDFIIGDTILKNYSGTPSYFQTDKYVDIHISSLSKGLGCFGGYVGSSNIIKEYMVNKSRPFIFTSALPDIFCILAEASLNEVKKGNLQQKLYSNIRYFHKRLDEHDLLKIEGNRHSPIIPILVGSEKRSMDISRQLLKKGLFVQAIRYPTVKKNEARLRISLSSNHSHEQLDTLVSSMTNISKSL